MEVATGFLELKISSSSSS
jgi:hypothetical protein